MNPDASFLDGIPEIPRPYEFQQKNGTWFVKITPDLYEGGEAMGMHNAEWIAIPAPVPEPSSLALILPGIAILGYLKRRKK